MRVLLVLLLFLLVGCAVSKTNDLDPLTTARTGKPNDALLCPEGEIVSCKAAPTGRVGWYDVPPERLFVAWREVLAAAPRTTLTRLDEQAMLLQGQQESRVFRFTDQFAVRVVADPALGASYAAYSRSLVGYGDLGVNAKRLKDWSEAVGEALGRASK